MKSSGSEKRQARTRKKASTKLPFEKENYILFAVSLVVLTLGFVFLSMGPWDSFSSLTLAPILLVIGYCVTLPFAILYKKKTEDKE